MAAVDVVTSIAFGAETMLKDLFANLAVWTRDNPFANVGAVQPTHTIKNEKTTDLKCCGEFIFIPRYEDSGANRMPMSNFRHAKISHDI